MKPKSPAWIDLDRNEKSNQMWHGSTVGKMFNQTKLPFELECSVLHKNVSSCNPTTNHSYDFTAQTDKELICLKWWNFNEISFHLFHWHQFAFIIAFILLLSLRLTISTSRAISLVRWFNRFNMCNQLEYGCIIRSISKHSYVQRKLAISLPNHHTINS